MTVVYTNAVKVARMEAVVTEAGSTAVLEICSAAYAAVLATIPLDSPIGTVAGAGVLTLDGFPSSDTSADNSGTAALARIRTDLGGTPTIILNGLTVGAGSGEVNLDSVTITAGQNVTINSAVITHAA